MKLFLSLVAACAALALLLLTPSRTFVAGTSAQSKKRPEILQLGADAKLGPVSFNHTNHTTKNYNIAGTGPIDCVECHHVEQPAAEVAKHPPLKSAWPADRTATLTAAALDDPKTPEVIGCRNCHSRAATQPKLWPQLPEIKHETSTAIITMTNQQAFHRNCATCHDAIVKDRPTAKAPRTAQCTLCHKKAAG